MPFQKHVPKEHYKYNDCNEVRAWKTQTFQDRLEDINPEVIIKLSLEGMDPNAPDFDIYEYLKPTEFDAYSLQITMYIKDAYKKQHNRPILTQWIASPSFGTYTKDIIQILHMPNDILNIIPFWREKNPIYFRKLRQRIYNEVIKEEIYENTF